VVNWTSYNESLVRRGEVILDFDIVDGWYVELERMNEGKRGATYGYPNSFVQLLGYVKPYFHLPYRQTEGVVRAHATNKIPSIPDYSTINRRINRLDIEINEHVGKNIVKLDSTGIYEITPLLARLELNLQSFSLAFALGHFRHGSCSCTSHPSNRESGF
jgi:hypothetical protein